MSEQLSLVDLMLAALCGVPRPAVQAWREERDQRIELEVSRAAAAGAEVVSLELYRRAKAVSAR